MWIVLLLLQFAFGLATPLPDGAVARLGSPHRGVIQPYLVAFSPDNRYLAESTHPPAIWIWELATNRRITALSTGQHHVAALALGKNGRIVALLQKHAGSCEVHTWDMITGRPYLGFTVDGGSPMALSSDGEVAAFLHTKYVGSSSRYWISIWSTALGRHIRNVGEPHLATKVTITRDNQSVVLHLRDQGFRVYHIATGKETGAFMPIGDFRDLVHWPIVSPDGRRALFQSNPPRLVDLNDGSGIGICPHAGDFRLGAFSQSGKKLALVSSTGSIRVWDIERQREAPPLLDSSEYSTAVAFSADERYLASANGPRMPRVWDLQSGIPMRGFDGHRGRLAEIVFSPDSRALASYVKESNHILVWDVAQRRVRHVLGQLDGEYCNVRFSPNGALLCAFENRRRAVVAWDAATGSEVVRLPEHERGIAGYRILPDSKSIVTAGGDGTVRWFELPSGKILKARTGFTISPNRTSAQLIVLAIRSSISPSEGFIDFSPDGALLASVSLEGGHWDYGNATAWLRGGKYVLRVWSTDEAKVLYQKELADRSHPRFSRDGKALWVGVLDVQSLDARTGASLNRSARLPATMQHVDWLPGERWLVSGRHHAPAGDRSGFIGDTDVNVLRPLPDANQGLVTVAAASPDGNLLATGGTDGTIVLWNAPQLKERMKRR